MILVIKNGLVFATHDDTWQEVALTAPGYVGLEIDQVANGSVIVTDPLNPPAQPATVTVLRSAD